MTTDAIELDNLRRSNLGQSYIISGLICDAFEALGLRGQPSRAMTVQFRRSADGPGGAEAATLALHAPMNYVGVYLREGDFMRPPRDLGGEWKVLAYHDSCWRGDGVERFILDNRDELEGLAMGGLRVVGVSEDEQKIFREVRRRQDEEWRKARS
jgi:hypothetical protein